MTDPSERLAAVRRGLDAAEQQATAATPGPWECIYYDDDFGDVSIRPVGEDPGYYTEIARAGQWLDGSEKSPTAEHIAAWSPAHVLAVVGSLRTICDGIEATLADHLVVEMPGRPRECSGWGHAGVSVQPEWCVDKRRALSSLAGLAAVWAPTEQETP